MGKLPLTLLVFVQYLLDQYLSLCFQVYDIFQGLDWVFGHDPPISFPVHCKFKSVINYIPYVSSFFCIKFMWIRYCILTLFLWEHSEEISRWLLHDSTGELRKLNILMMSTILILCILERQLRTGLAYSFIVTYAVTWIPTHVLKK